NASAGKRSGGGRLYLSIACCFAARRLTTRRTQTVSASLRARLAVLHDALCHVLPQSGLAASGSCEDPLRFHGGGKLIRLSWLLAAALAAVSLSSEAAAQSAPATCALQAKAGTADRMLTSGGRQRLYRLFVPASYDGHTALPLVLDLHGSGGNAAGQAATS